VKIPRGPVRAAAIITLTIGLVVSWTFAAQAASNVIWNSAFTEKGFAKFRDTPYNDVGAAAPVLVTSTVNPPEKAARFTVPGGGTRSEIEPKVFTFTEGSDYYFGDSFTLPSTFPVAEPSWQVITQWKNDGDGSPPVEIKVGNGNVFIDGGYGYPKGPAGKKYWSKPIGPAVTAAQTSLVVHIHFSRTPSVGLIDVWLNGKQVISGYHPPSGTLYPKVSKKKATAQVAAAQQQAQAATPQPAGTPKEPGAATDEDVTESATAAQFDYWKMGMYRDPEITSTATYDIESARVATTYAAAAK
jgi:hypothetical protein